MTIHTKVHGTAEKHTAKLVRRALRCAFGDARAELHRGRQLVEARRAWEEAILRDQSQNPDQVLQGS